MACSGSGSGRRPWGASVDRRGQELASAPRGSTLLLGAPCLMPRGARTDGAAHDCANRWHRTPGAVPPSLGLERRDPNRWGSPTGSQPPAGIALRGGLRPRCLAGAHPGAGAAREKSLLRPGAQRGSVQRMPGQRPHECRGHRRRTGSPEPGPQTAPAPPPSGRGRSETADSASPRSSGGRIRTCDLWVMSPASYRAAPPRVGTDDCTSRMRREGARLPRPPSGSPRRGG